MSARTVFMAATLLLVLEGRYLSAQERAEQQTSRIEGRVQELPNVAHLSNVTVHSIELYLGDSGRPFSKRDVDSEGHFVFEDVPSGRVRLHPVFRIGTVERDVSLSSALLVPAILRSGATLEIALLGKGRPVVGKIVLPAGVKPQSVRVWLRLLEPPFRTLHGRDGRPVRSPEFAVYSALTANALESPLDAEGRFRIEGVREGNYRIGVKVVGDGGESLAFKGVAERGYPNVEYGKLTVPFTAGDESNQAHDLGSLKFDLPPRSR